jgi:hypothetical protein
MWLSVECMYGSKERSKKALEASKALMPGGQKALTPPTQRHHSIRRLLTGRGINSLVVAK